MKENIEKSSPETDKLRRFYEYVLANIPEGLLGDENSWHIKLGERYFDVIIFEMESGKVRLGLFVDGGKYARKTLEIDRDGKVTEDTSGVIPEIDLIEDEPDFSNISNEQIVMSAIDQIQNYKRDKLN